MHLQKFRHFSAPGTELASNVKTLTVVGWVCVTDHESFLSSSCGIIYLIDSAGTVIYKRRWRLGWGPLTPCCSPLKTIFGHTLPVIESVVKD